jgi:hypothetical protein
MRSIGSTTKQLCWVLAFVLLCMWSGLPEYLAYAEAPQSPNTTAVQNFDALLNALRSVEREVPRTTFDPKAILAHTGTDYHAIFTWVKDETALVAYRGMLRGASGVLMDRDGNALDRALLLNHLLILAGYETRLARGSLSREQALALANDIRLPPARAPHWVYRYATGEAQPVDPDSDKLYTIAVDRIETQSADLLARVAPNRRSVEAMQDEERDKAAEILADHWWVQLRHEDRWIDLDPSLNMPGRRRSEATTTMTANDLPKQLAHRVTVRLILETWQGTQPHETTIFAHSASATDLMGRTIYVGHVPLGVDDKTLRTAPSADLLLDALAEAKAWLPLIAVEDKLYKGSLMTATGDLLEPTDTNLKRFQPPQGVGGLGDAISKGFEGAFKGFPGGGPREPKSPPASVTKRPAFANVTAEWLEYEIAVPGEQLWTIRRELFDLIGYGPRQSSPPSQPNVSKTEPRRRVAGLVSGSHVIVETAKVAPEVVIQRLLRKFSALEPLVREMQQAGGTVSKQRLHQFLPQLRTLQVDLDLLASLRWQSNVGSEEVFINQPNITALRRAMRLAKSGDWMAETTIDIVTNDVGVRHIRGLDPFEARLTQGVADTVSEAVLFDAAALPANTAVLHELAAAKNIRLMTLTPSAPDTVRSLSLPESAKNRIADDLRAGHIVVVPQSPITLDVREVTAWWRIHPHDGRVLGIVADGTGGAMLEYLILVSEVLLTAADVYFFLDCVIGGSEGVFFTASLKGNSALERIVLCTAEALVWEILGIVVLKAFEQVLKVMAKELGVLAKLLRDETGALKLGKHPPDAAEFGRKFHEMEKRAMREQLEKIEKLEDGWEVWKIDETVGGTKRPDFVYINRDKHKVLITDTYTGTKGEVMTPGGPESIRHNRKGWKYFNEPDIRKLIEDGYDVQYVPGIRPRGKSPDELH